MTNDLLKAKYLLKKYGYTHVICKGRKYEVSKEQGIKPLAQWLEMGVIRNECCIASKVTTQESIVYYKMLGAEQVFSLLISAKAKETLKKFGISCFADVVVTQEENLV